MTKKIQNRKCKICEKEITVVTTVVGSTNKKIKFGASDTKTRKFIDSKEGVFFLKVWFCNSCWKEILNHGNIRT